MLLPGTLAGRALEERHRQDAGKRHQSHKDRGIRLEQIRTGRGRIRLLLLRQVPGHGGTDRYQGHLLHSHGYASRVAHGEVSRSAQRLQGRHSHKTWPQEALQLQQQSLPREDRDNSRKDSGALFLQEVHHRLADRQRVQLRVHRVLQRGGPRRVSRFPAEGIRDHRKAQQRLGQ